SATGSQVALPDRRVPASVGLDQGLHQLILREKLLFKGLYKRRARSSASSAGSRTNGRSRPCAYAGSTAFGYTLS
ncbi:MAG: hypothetical protein JWL67_998, partial [Solirubrobacterales bacterium]|nr:hypothetical protein [Solirubrobacterales bacterium]